MAPQWLLAVTLQLPSGPAEIKVTDFISPEQERAARCFEQTSVEMQTQLKLQPRSRRDGSAPPAAEATAPTSASASNRATAGVCAHLQVCDETPCVAFFVLGEGRPR